MIEILNLGFTLDQLEKLADEGKLNNALGKACAIVEADAKRKAPKDTGALRRSITSKVDGNEGIVYTPLEYAPYVEFGTGLFAENGGRQTPWSYVDEKGNGYKTVGQHPQPFMRPALDENVDKIVKTIKEGLLK